jgi:hypothetical protein
VEDLAAADKTVRGPLVQAWVERLASQCGVVVETSYSLGASVNSLIEAVQFAGFRAGVVGMSVSC